MIISVSSVNGTSGSRNTGSVEGSSPMSDTVRRSIPSTSETVVSTTMHTSGEGSARVIIGKP